MPIHEPRGTALPIAAALAVHMRAVLGAFCCAVSVAVTVAIVGPLLYVLLVVALLVLVLLPMASATTILVAALAFAQMMGPSVVRHTPIAATRPSPRGVVTLREQPLKRRAKIKGCGLESGDAEGKGEPIS